MARKRKNGTGTIRQRKDGRWEGRAVVGYDDKGLPKTKNVLAKTKRECQEKLTLLMEVPEMGGTPEKVDVTTLADASKKYIDGIKDYGDLAFKFLYENTEGSAYRILRGYEEAGTVADYKVELPDGTGFAFSGQVSTKIDSAAVNAALTFTATISLNSDMVVTNPTE